ncbi:GNAT family N-acetyltransferase [Leptothoe spongobia]|uniref:GNAT family N-acetyltransferase n=1 Tax=Leptothoe spongobia TAU-MAC 1115 TaxID=1967444 RepID=A0A947DGY8_9CYAN|nr:GNAT family N-acetyltransferase [Leptothoe spongobia]MBT9316199.1 GNAT family N-acetyltransferase [Leptothoe spongobia TAU-MAC 1115]
MEFKFCPLTKNYALAILAWQYPAPYDVYNFKENNLQADLPYLLEPQHAFFAILNQQGELEGYCSFGSDGRVPGGDYSEPALDIGMGIKPDLIGQGNGKHYAMAVARYGIQRYQATQLRVTIAGFNQRAQRVWQSLEFQTVELFYKTGSREKFIVMVRCNTMSKPFS